VKTVGSRTSPSPKESGSRQGRACEADGIIAGYQALISPAAANQSFEVLLDVEITDFDMKSIETFETTMAGYPQVLELHRLFGSPDYLVRVAVADLPAYEQFLTSKVLAIPGIHRVSSRFPMKTIKSLRPL